MPYKDKEKQREAQRRWAKQNRKDNPNHRVYLNQIREENKLKVRALKESAPCMDCGNFYAHYVMDYDHRDPSTKVRTVSALVNAFTWAAVLLEIEKCDLVCSNCHRIRTHS